MKEELRKIGIKKRDLFKVNISSVFIGKMLKEERNKAKLTQEQLADKVGVKKSYISRIENGKTDIQLSTLFRLFEYGLNKEVLLKLN